MAQIPVVYGEWVVKGFLWECVVNNRKGGRMFLVPDGCTHGELHEMALEDYDLDKKIEKVELTYSLPDVILQQMASDTPPMHVTSDRQVRNLIELAKTHFVRLCVSSQSQVEAGVDHDADVSDGDDSNFADEDTGQDTDSEWDEDSNDADDVQATADYVQATVAVDVDNGVNYSDYGKVKDEDSDVDANEMLYDGYKAQFSGGEGRSLSLKDNIYVDQSFASKIPYSHAIAAAKDANINVTTLVCPSYSKNYLYAAYAANIYPKSDVLEAPNTDDTSPANEEEAPNTDDTTPANEEGADKARKCLPPEVKRGRGRQKKSR
ncbi:unnamed protein product [Brassica napus]|uniref:(rape) hypothetical protein n=1 Tax=Brassica napus TaxID=3708 RepID=A0A816Q533_BRANA|nr:unnamed protein product [Brassica napus]